MRKSVVRTLLVYSLLPVGIFMLSVVFIMFFFLPGRDRVVEAMSPDGKIVAVVEECNGGATTSFWYDVYLEPHPSFYGFANRTPVAQFDAATRSESAWGVDIEWVSSSDLLIKYYKAREIDFLNSRVTCNKKLVRVACRSDIQNAEAPSGGMLYNLQGRPYDRK